MSKYQICFVVCKKIVVFEDKNSDLFLLHKIKSFGLKNIKSIFEELKKMVFGFIKEQICFEINNCTFDNRKIRSGLYMLKKKNEKDFLRREFHS